MRGCGPFEAVDASAGSFRVFWPAAMTCAEGAVDAQVMVTSDREAISTLPFVVRVTQVLTGTGEGSDDGYSLFLEAIEKFEGADALISDAVAKAQQAADAARTAQAAAAQLQQAAQTAAATEASQETAAAKALQDSNTAQLAIAIPQ